MPNLAQKCNTIWCQIKGWIFIYFINHKYNEERRISFLIISFHHKYDCSDADHKKAFTEMNENPFTYILNKISRANCVIEFSLPAAHTLLEAVICVSDAHLQAWLEVSRAVGKKMLN